MTTKFTEMIRDEMFRKRLEKAGFRVISEVVQEAEQRAAGYPPGHCWHMVPRRDTEPPQSCQTCAKTSCACAAKAP